MQVKIKKSVHKEILKLPRRIQILYRDFLIDLQNDGLHIQGWNLKKLQGKRNLFRARLTIHYRVLIEHIEPDLIIIRVASREVVYK